jgi:peptide/nickel transport system substrate-binding protein
MRLGKLTWLVGALFIAAILALAAACGDDDGGSSATATPAPTDTEPQTLTVAVSAEGAGFWWGQSWGLGFDVAFNTYDTILAFDENGAPIPNVMTSWEVQDDGGTFVMNFQDGITFESGNPLTAGDVLWSLELNRDCPGYGEGSFDQFHLGDFTGDIQDDTTLVLTLPKGVARSAIPVMAAHHGLIYDSKFIDEQTSNEACPVEWLSQNTAGSGPYTLESLTPGEEVVLKVREGYWKGDASIDEITYRIVPDPNTRFLLLQSGDVDVAWDIAPDKWEEIAADPNLNLNSVDLADPYFLAVDQDVAPFDDVNFRKALVKAWPYDTVIENTLNGFGVTNSSFSRPVDPWFKQYDLYTEDIAAAQAFLDQSAYADGTSITITINASDPLQADAVVWYQDALREINIDLQIEALPLAAIGEARINHEIPFMIHRFETWVVDLEYYAGFQWGTDSASNWVQYSNTEMDTVLDQAATVIGYDDPEIVQLLTQAQDIIAEDAVWSPVFLPMGAMATSTEVQGYEFVYYHPGVDFRGVTKS